MSTKKIYDRHRANTAKLPATCFTDSPLPGFISRINRGRRGQLILMRSKYSAADLNRGLGVTPKQAAAMAAGCRAGFHSRLANVDLYNDEGVLSY